MAKISSKHAKAFKGTGDYSYYAGMCAWDGKSHTIAGKQVVECINFYSALRFFFFFSTPAQRTVSNTINLHCDFKVQVQQKQTEE